jgi:hypothetical protein
MKLQERQPRHSCQCCKFCGEPITPEEPAFATFKDGSAAHEDCLDAEEFRKENAADLDRAIVNRWF